MALVRVIGLGGNIKVVPESIFRSSLSKMGYRLYEKSKPVEKDPEGNLGGEADNAGNMEDVESVPLSEMNGSQVKKYAELKGIDVSEAKSTKEAKEIIREWLNENEE